MLIIFIQALQVTKGDLGLKFEKAKTVHLGAQKQSSELHVQNDSHFVYYEPMPYLIRVRQSENNC